MSPDPIGERTVSKLSEIRAREQAATDGPWDRVDGHIMASERDITNEPYDLMGAICCKEPADVEFVAHSRADIPHLLDLVERLGKAINLSTHSLHFKHPGNFWDCERLGCKEACALLLEIKE